MNHLFWIQHEQLFRAVASGDLSTVMKTPPDSDQLAYQCLRSACAKGHTDIMTYLADECGVRFDAANGFGETLLHGACRSGVLRTVRYLTACTSCSQGVLDIDARDSRGETALHKASEHGHLEIVEYLVSACGARTDIATKDGRTVLYSSCLGGRLDIVRYLLSRMPSRDLSMNIHAQDAYGCTPFSEACRAHRLDLADYLLTMHRSTGINEDTESEMLLRIAQDRADDSSDDGDTSSDADHELIEGCLRAVSPIHSWGYDEYYDQRIAWSN